MQIQDVIHPPKKDPQYTIKLHTLHTEGQFYSFRLNAVQSGSPGGILKVTKGHVH